MVRDGEANEELRHSLRSLVNFGHDRLWLFGNRPSWVIGAHVVQLEQGGVGFKHHNTWANWRAIAHHPDVSDEFLFMNDDYYILRPIDAVPVLNAGPLVEWCAAANNNTRVRTAQTIDCLTGLGHRPVDQLSFELHVPMVINKGAMAEAVDAGQRWMDRAGTTLPMAKRSLYGNVAGLRGERSADVKIREKDDAPPRTATFCSTSDGSFRYGQVGRFLRQRFAAPGPYDGEAIPRPLRIGAAL